jgi:hypothetical protein
MNGERAFSVANLIIVALFLCVLANLLYLTWFALDHPPYLGSAVASLPILQLGEKSRFRNFWEIAFFVTSSALAISAIFAFFIARSQLHSAENVRLAGVYMEITKRWTSPELTRSRSLLLELLDFFERHRADPGLARFADRRDYICEVLVALKRENKRRFAEHMAIVSFFEDVGMLCRKNYLRKEDVFDFAGAPIVAYADLVLRYLELTRRPPAGGHTVYANTLWLYREAAKRKIYADDGLHLPAPRQL